MRVCAHVLSCMSTYVCSSTSNQSILYTLARGTTVIWHISIVYLRIVLLHPRGGGGGGYLFPITGRRVGNALPVRFIQRPIHLHDLDLILYQFRTNSTALSFKVKHDPFMLKSYAYN